MFRAVLVIGFLLTGGAGAEIVAVAPNPAAEGDAGEYVVLSFPNRTNLSGWAITDGESIVRLPDEVVSGRIAATTESGRRPSAGRPARSRALGPPRARERRRTGPPRVPGDDRRRRPIPPGTRRGAVRPGRRRLAVAAGGRDLDPLAGHAGRFENLGLDPFELFLEETSPRADTTLRNYRNSFRHWRRHMEREGRHPACPARSHVESYVRRRADEGVKRSTVDTELTHLGAAFSYWARDEAFPHAADFDPFDVDPPEGMGSGPRSTRG